MDVISAEALAAAVGAAANSAASEAGRQAWESLLTLWRRFRGTQAVELVEDPGDPEQVQALTGRVIEEHRRNSAFASELTQWAQRFSLTVENDRSSSHNTVSGNAQVNGTVIQARDISGPINFGNSS
jgi:hypothetical protein